ncbi:monocarboxylate transporter 10-like [Podarcis lilfordi]|uniref:Monocarboxylate transporter 10-like n=3 Tax=Podarcis lilfordi TaxID=74358 RepID=A0AA35K4Z0_9SAUR|nr:monocarboxylate transporter 10-like [Podarcis lilfordi]
MSILQRFQSVVLFVRHGLRRQRTLAEINADASFVHPPPDGAWGWVVVLAAAIHSLFISGFHSAFGVYMMPLLTTFKASNSQIAWIGSISYAFIMIFGPVSGKLLVKYGAIKVAIIGAMVVMIGLMCSSYTYDLRLLFFTHGIIVGVGSSLGTTPGLIMVSLYFTKKRSFATGIVMAGGCAGTFVQNKLHEYLIQTLGWRRSLRVYSGILIICIIAGFAYQPLQKHRAHPSVVEKFKTSPLRGFIVDLSLWKDRIFEVWVCSLGLAKFGFFIPFVHMIKLAGDLGIPLEKASYIMVAIGVSSMVSSLLFGKLCDIERIDRLYLNQVSILSVGVVYFIIPHCTNFSSLIAACSVLGFVDAGNYVLLPVLTFDLMGPEKMPVAWGFLMVVNASSCFGAPFAGAMYDLLGNYNIGFVVTGICNIAAASILAFIPWLQRETTQSSKNYLNASVCVITNTIVPWQSPTPSLGSLTSSYTKTLYAGDETQSYHSKRFTGSIKSFSVKSLKSIMKSDATGPLTKAEPKSSAGTLEIDSQEQVERKTDLMPMQELSTPETSFKSESGLIKHPEYISYKKEDVLAFLNTYEADDEEKFVSEIDLRPKKELTVSDAETFESTKQSEHIPHKREDVVAFVNEYDGEEEEEKLDTTKELKPKLVWVLPTSDEEMSGERKVAFADDHYDDEDVHFGSVTNLRPVQVLTISDAETPESTKPAERRVAFADDQLEDKGEHLEGRADTRPVQEIPVSDAETLGSFKQAERRVAFADDYDDAEGAHTGSLADLRPRQVLSISDAETLGSFRPTERRVSFADDHPEDKGEHPESRADAKSSGSTHPTGYPPLIRGMAFLENSEGDEEPSQFETNKNPL